MSNYHRVKSVSLRTRGIAYIETVMNDPLYTVRLTGLALASVALIAALGGASATVSAKGIYFFSSSGNENVQRESRAVQTVDPEGGLSQLTVLNIAGEKAVVRFGPKGKLEVIAVGDRLGKNKAEVKEIAADHLVLEETFVGQNGRPNQARVVVKKGETGGTRYLLRPEDPPPARRPLVVQPPGDPKKPQK